MKIFFSLSDRMYLTKAQPVPISASVMNRRAPLSLRSKYRHTHVKKNKKTNTKWPKRHIVQTSHLQVCYIIHDGPAFDGMPLSVDKVIVDLREK